MSYYPFRPVDGLLDRGKSYTRDIRSDDGLQRGRGIGPHD